MRGLTSKPLGEKTGIPSVGGMPVLYRKKYMGDIIHPTVTLHSLTMLP